MGPCPLVVTIIVNYCCTRVGLCCTRKMLKETDTEETIGFFVIVLSLVAFQLGEAWGPSPPPLATPMGNTLEKLQVMR